MKLGTPPDTFYTEDNIRTLDNGVPSDLVIHVNNVSFHLHKVNFHFLKRAPPFYIVCDKL